MSALLEVDELVVTYGPAVAVDGVSLELKEGERVALVGPNGAGKSSLLNAICGLVKPSAGRVRIDNRDVTRAAPGRIVRLGVTQVPEGRQVFPSLPVEANLLLGAYGRDFRREPFSATVR
jgi:branched-chain amino acid transport system ATP-binding protein